MISPDQKRQAEKLAAAYASKAPIIKASEQYYAIQDAYLAGYTAAAEMLSAENLGYLLLIEDQIAQLEGRDAEIERLQRLHLERTRLTEKYILRCEGYETALERIGTGRTICGEVSELADRAREALERGRAGEG